MTLQDRNHRAEERVTVALPVNLGTATGTTRDVSATGVYFEVDATYALGSGMDFEVELDTPGGPMRMKCRGEIVRIEPQGRRVGVAVKITESKLEAADKI